MNRDCNLEELAYESQSGGKIIRLSDLQDWLTDKKVIKKGLQPHPYADVLHEWVEGAEIVASEDMKHNHDVSSAKSKLRGSYYLKKCIKPLEPIYEYQWYYIRPDRTVRVEENFLIEAECAAPWIKFEETKRERKQ